MIRAVPLLMRRASLRADSCDFNRPNRGSTTCMRSGSTRIDPVVNRTDGVVRRRDLNRGKPAGRPARHFGTTAENAATAVAADLVGAFPGLRNSRWFALRLLEGDPWTEAAVRSGRLPVR